MIETLPTHGLALVGVVFLLGLKHGLSRLAARGA